MEYKQINGRDFYNMVVNGSNRLSEESDYVNSLNVFPVPDGDTGTNMSMTFKAAVKEIENMKSESIGEVSKKLAKGALMGARGNSGVILSQILRGISKGLEGKDEVNARELAVAFEEGSKAAYRAVMRPTEGTILSVIRATAEAAVKINQVEVVAFMEEITKEAKVMLDKTPEMLPALKKAKVVDSGGMGLYIILAAMTEALKDGIQAEIKDIKIGAGGGEQTSAGAGIDPDSIKFGYCTEFIILGNAERAEEFKSLIGPMGDCMIVVGYDDVIKTHIHTNNPGGVLEKAVMFGELSKIKIDNMREEHREILANELREEIKKNEEAAKPEKYGFITVAMGSGISNIFKDLGADFVIEGGQTMNPSTQDILDSIAKINAENIFVFPNNKNIIMAAEQAAEIAEKNVVVIKTTSIQQGITLLSMFNKDGEVSENVQELNELLETIKVGSVTYAVRDTEMDGIEIKEGNMLGLVEGKIKEVGEDKFQVAEKVLENIVDEDSELITIFYGEDVTEEEANSFVEKIEEKYTECDVQLYKGEQPLYYLLMSVE